MLFSSLSFLFYFFPAVLLIHYFLPQGWQNPFLFLASLVFYAWGDARYIPLFFALLAVDWGAGLLLEKTKTPWRRKLCLALGVGANMGSLLFYKYIGFFLETLGLNGAVPLHPSLPLGISFFTFQAVGYLVDVYRGETRCEKDPVAFGTFLFLFPQLIAGPIVRYRDLAVSLHRLRKPGGQALESGMACFVAGLASKVLLANPLGELSAEMKALSGDAGAALIFLLAYGLQIYFDFMGYSIMAVGMGRMLGFSFPRNFRHPYAASSVTDFWRRWHITLSGWFRDYVYIPLGGNRRGTGRTLLNMLIVWGLTGFWHGAGWNFILWGLWYFFCLTLDKFVLEKRSFPSWTRRGWMLFSVAVGWGLFSADSAFGSAWLLKSLAGLHFSGRTLFFLRDYGALLAVSVLLCVPKLVEKGKALMRRRPAVRLVSVLGLMALCLAALAESSYNPFLYFHF